MHNLEKRLEKIIATKRANYGTSADAHELGICHGLEIALDLVRGIQQETVTSPLLDQFWDFVLENEGQLNHAHDSGLVALNVLECIALVQEMNVPGLAEVSRSELRSLLRNSARFPFVEVKKVRSKRLEKTINCWVFKRNGHHL